MGGEGGGGEWKYRVHFTSWAARDILIFWKRNHLSNKALISQYSAKHCIWIGQTKGKKSKRERKHDCFERNSRFWTAIHFTCSRRFLLTSLCNVPGNTRPGMGYNSQHFFSNFHVLKTWFELLRIKLYRNSLKGNKNYVELAGGSSYWGQNYSKGKKEIQGKSTLVQVSVRFELVRVWVIGSWLYM